MKPEHRRRDQDLGIAPPNSPLMFPYGGHGSARNGRNLSQLVESRDGCMDALILRLWSQLLPENEFFQECLVKDLGVVVL